MKGRMKRALKTGKKIEPLQSTMCYTEGTACLLPAALVRPALSPEINSSVYTSGKR